MGLKSLQGQGANYVPAYQTSGTPFVTSSIAPAKGQRPLYISFPYVTKNITIQNLDTTAGDNLRIAFTYSGSFKVGETLPGGGGAKPNDFTNEDGTVSYQASNYFVVPSMAAAANTGNPGNITLDVRCKELYLMSDSSNPVAFSLYAGMTGISRNQFPVLTASANFKGVG